MNNPQPSSVSDVFRRASVLKKLKFGCEMFAVEQKLTQYCTSMIFQFKESCGTIHLLGDRNVIARSISGLLDLSCTTTVGQALCWGPWDVQQ